MHSAERDYGIDSSLHVACESSAPVPVSHANPILWHAARFGDRQLWRLQRSPRDTWRSPALFGCVTAEWINSYPCDVVNLHWITNGFLSVETVGRITKPIVWTMYDMWPFTGTEHYAPDGPRARWIQGYSAANRPLDESGLDLDRWSFERKERHWSMLRDSTTMVPASTWLESTVRQSALMGGWRVERIPHVVDTSIFKPADRQQARNSIGLPLLPDSKTVLFLSSGGITDPRKGWDLLEQACTAPAIRELSLTIIIVGPRPSEEDAQRIGLRVGHNLIWFGHVTSSADLCALYCSADVVAVPSRQDNMPLTAMEAQSCNIPVAGFAIGGLPDIVGDGETGALSPDVSADGLAEALTICLSRDFGSAPRERALRTWAPDIVTERYRRLYASLL